MTIDRRAFMAGVVSLAAYPAPAGGQPAPAADPLAARLVAAAEAQVGVTTHYDPAYQRIPFPGGDVARERGVCTDVVVRAYRDAFGLDLQALVNADMRGHFSQYPTRWGLTRPDPNIDHRRVPNLRVFLARQGSELPLPRHLADWQPGDIVTQELSPPGELKSAPPHVGIVAAILNAGRTRRLVIHNIGSGTRIEDILETFRITGRYRWLPPIARG